MKKLKNFKKLAIAIVAIVINVNLAYSQGNNWKLDGNDNVTNRSFIGTTNNKDLNFKTNNETRMVVTKDGDVNVSNTLTADSIHVHSIRVGEHSLWLGGNAQLGNDFIQSNAGYINVGRWGGAFSDITFAIAKQISTPNPNTFANIKLDVGGGINVDANQGYCIGNSVMLSNKGNSNIFLGLNSGANWSGSSNTGIGNTTVGANAGEHLTTGNFNLFCGNNTGLNTTSGSYNVFLGPAIATVNTTGSYNTFAGHSSGNLNTGTNNAFFGYRAGRTNTTGTFNTYIGNNTSGTNNLTNASAIGANAIVTASNSMVLGSISGQNGATANTSVGIGVTAPARRLEVMDNIKPQLRLTNISGSRYTDFQTYTDGSLLINPTNSRVGINLATNNLPTEALDVFGNARIRQMPTTTNDLEVVKIDNNGVLYRGTVAGGGAVTAVNGTSVNANGEVELGTNPLDHDTELPLAGKYLNFSGQSTDMTTNSIGLGLDNTTAPKAKLHIVQSALNPASTANITTLMINNENNLSGNSVTNYGINCSSTGKMISGKTINIGGNFYAENGYFNYGIKTEVNSDGNGIGIWAIGNKAGQFDGSLRVNGIPSTSNTIWVTSDGRFKENISSIPNAVQKIQQLQPHTYTYKTVEYPQFNFVSGTQYGFIADEVVNVIPEVVMEETSSAVYDEQGNEISPELTFKSLNYSGLIPVAIQGIKELDTRVTDLENTGGSNNSGWSGAGTGQMYSTNVNDKITIGETSSSNCKFNVRNTTEQFCANFYTDATNLPSGSIPSGMRCQVGNSSGIGIGLEGVAYSNNQNAQNYGLRGEAGGTASQNTGLIGNAYGQSNLNIGISAYANGGNTNWALYSYAPNGATNSVAGYFQGNVNINGNLTAYNFPSSDVMLKENIQNIPNSLSLISQLNPKTFNFKTAEYPQMRLPEGNQFGLIAQEVEAIMPDIVIDAYQPADIDTAGNQLHAGFTYKALNYEALIPVLIQSVKDQQDSINQLKSIIANYESRFSNIETMLANCCSNGNNGNNGNGNNGNGNGNTKSTDVNSVINITPDNSISKKETVLEQNVPNPFTVKTTFNYTIGTKGSVELEIMTYSGQYVTTLVNTNQEEGSYSIDWNTSNIAPGIYFYTLRVDGVEWVKKAIRIK